METPVATTTAALTDAAHAVLGFYYANAKVIFAVLIAGAVVGEFVIRWLRGRDLQLRSTTTSIVSAFAFMGVKLLVGKALFIGLGLYIYQQHRLFDLDLGDPLVWIGVFLIRDLVYYWVHRTEHVVRLLWASHLVHHSPETIGMATAVRVPWMEALYKPWFSLWMPLLGFNPVAAIAFDVFAATLSQAQHTERFAVNPKSIFGKFFVTPSHHRVHHGYNPEYIDKNFGAVLIVWDKLFGTFAPEAAPVKFGVGKVDAVVTPADALVGGFARLRADVRGLPFAAAVGVLFSMPGSALPVTRD